MNLFLVVICIVFSTAVYAEGSNGTYEDVYIQQKQNFDNMLQERTIHETIYNGILEIFVNATDEVIFDRAELDTFEGFLKDLNNFTDDGNYTDEEFTDFMDEIQMVMFLTTPTLYEAMRFKEIPSLGTLQNIFAMGVEFGFYDAWSLIRASSENGSCNAYDQLLVAVTETPAYDYIKDVFDQSLCTLSKDTMEKWHQVFDQIDPLQRTYLLIQEFNNGLPVFVFAKIAKTYRSGVYAKQFEKYVYTYPIIIALDRAIESTAFTKEEKKMLQALATEMREQFPVLDGPEDRETFTSTKFTEIVSENPLFLKTFAKIRLINDDASFYDLIMWITQRSILEDMYDGTVSNQSVSFIGHRRKSFWEWTSIMPKPCSICKVVMEISVIALKKNENSINAAIGTACLKASSRFKILAKLFVWACEPVMVGITDALIDAFAKGTADGEICKNINICQDSL